MSTALLGAWTLAGFAAGLVHFLGLRRNVRLYVSSGRLRQALALQAARLALTVALFVAAARQGAVPLLLAAAGFLLARTAVLARRERAAP